MPRRDHSLRSVLLAAALPLAMAAGGCGGSAETPATALARFRAAIAANDLTAACGHVGDGFWQELGRRTTSTGDASCVKLATRLLALPGKFRQQLAAAHVTGIDVTGATARVRFTSEFDFFRPRPWTLTMRQHDGRWLITGLCPPPESNGDACVGA